MTLSPIPDLVAQSELCLQLGLSLYITCTLHTHRQAHTAQGQEALTLKLLGRQDVTECVWESLSLLYV